MLSQPPLGLSQSLWWNSIQTQEHQWGSTPVLGWVYAAAPLTNLLQIRKPFRPKCLKPWTLNQKWTGIMGQENQDHGQRRTNSLLSVHVTTRGRLHHLQLHDDHQFCAFLCCRCVLEQHAEPLQDRRLWILSFLSRRREDTLGFPTKMNERAALLAWLTKWAFE